MEDRDMADSTELKNPPTFRERDKWIVALLAAELPHATARVAVAIAMHLRVETGQCNPRHKILARASNVSERSIYRHIELLERAGWIEIERAIGCPNQFYLTPANSMAEVPVPKREATSAKIAPNLCHTVAEQNCGTAKRTAPSAPPSAGPEGKESDDQGFDRDAPFGGARLEAAPPINEKKEKSGDEWFGEFRRQYPKSEGEDGAREEFTKLINDGVNPRTIIAAAMRFAAERIGQPERFTPLAANWLRKGHWKDPPRQINGNGQDPEHRPRRTGNAKNDQMAKWAAMAAELKRQGH
jgi:hypothetical protein